MQLRKADILFRTKGGHKEGMGDVTSCLGLAEKFRAEGYEVLFICNDNEHVAKLISANGFEYRTANTLAELDGCVGDLSIGVAILVQLDTPKDEGLIFREHSQLLVTIDDTGPSAKLADLRFNVLYPIEDSLCDFEYVTLSDKFQRQHETTKVIKGRTETIMVTQGGSDTYGFTPKIVEALYDIPGDICINVVLGPNFSHHNQLNAVLDISPRAFNIVQGRSDLSGLMLQADLAVSAGGITLFELACVGVPTVVVCGEPFEVQTARRLQENGFGINLGFGEHTAAGDIYDAVNELAGDRDLRSKMSDRGKALVDGRGSERIVGRIVNCFHGKRGSKVKSVEY